MFRTNPTIRDAVIRDVFLAKGSEAIEATELIDTVEDVGPILTESGVFIYDEAGQVIYGD